MLTFLAVTENSWHISRWYSTTLCFVDSFRGFCRTTHQMNWTCKMQATTETYQGRSASWTRRMKKKFVRSECIW